MNTTQIEHQLRSGRSNQAPNREAGFDADLPARIIDRLEQLQLLQAELLGKAQAWNRIALISETDANGVILAVNDNFVRTSGYTRDELQGQNHSLLKSGHQHDSIFEQMWQQLLAGKVWRGYLKNKTQKGDYFWVYSTIFPILDEHRKPVRFYSVAIPVTELIEPSEEIKLNLLPAFALTPDSQSRQLQQLRQQLQTIKAEHEHALRAIHQAVLIAETDSRGIITAVNDYFVEVTGYEKHELIGQNHRLLKSPEQSPSVYDELWRTISQGITWRGLLINRRKNGTDYRVEIQITPELDEEGKVRRYLALSWKLSDATEQAFAEAAQFHQSRLELERLAEQYDESQRLIAELENMQQLLFSQVSALNAAAYVLEIDLKGHITFVNDSLVQRTGFLRESLFGQPLEILIGSSMDAHERSALERSAAASSPWRGYLPIRTQAAEEFWTYLVLHPVDNPDTGRVEKAVLILTDSQASKQRIIELENELRLIRGQEQELQRTVTDLYYKTTQLQRIQQEYESRQVGLEQAFPLIETDPAGIVLFVNDVFCRQYATRPADWMGKGFDTWLATRVSADKADAWLLQTRTTPADPLILPAQDFDLQPRSFVAYTCPIHDGDGNWVKQLYLLVPAFDIASAEPAPPSVAELERLQLANEQLEAQLAQLREQLDQRVRDSEFQRHDYEEQLAALQAQLTELQADQSTAHPLEGFVSIEVYRAAELARETLEQRIQALVRDKEANYSNFQKAHESNLQLKNQYDGLIKELEDERRWAAELQERYVQLERDLRNLESESENKDIEIKQIQRKYADLEQLNEEVVLSVQELRNQLRDLQLELEYAQEQEVQRKNELIEHVAVIDSLRSQTERLTNEKIHLEADLQSAQLRLEKMGTDKKVLESEVESLTTRLEKQLEDRKFLEVEIDSLKSRLDKLVDDRKDEVQHMQERLDQLARDKYRVEEQFKDLKYSYSEQQENSFKLEEENRNFRLGQDQLNSRLAYIEAQRIELQAERDTLSHRVQQLSQEVVRLRHELELVSDQAQALTSNNERLAARVRDLEQQTSAGPPTQSPPSEELRAWVGFSPPQAKSVSRSPVRSTSLKLLFVEADFPRLDTVGSWMKDWGIDCKVSARGDDALAIYESFKPDVVILDLRLPGLSGFELIDVIRNDYEDQLTKIIALTPVELLVHRSEYLHSGFTEVIGKPYDRADLELVLRKLNLFP